MPGRPGCLPLVSAECCYFRAGRGPRSPQVMGAANEPGACWGAGAWAHQVAVQHDEEAAAAGRPGGRRARARGRARPARAARHRRAARRPAAGRGRGRRRAGALPGLPASRQSHMCTGILRLGVSCKPPLDGRLAPGMQPASAGAQAAAVVHALDAKHRNSVPALRESCLAKLPTPGDPTAGGALSALVVPIFISGSAAWRRAHLAT